jgi:hypothetical protein
MMKLNNPSSTHTYDCLTRNGVAERLLRARQDRSSRLPAQQTSR